MNWTAGDIEKLKNSGLKVTGLDAQNIQHENKELFKKVKREMRHEESDLQQRCVETFRLIYPKLKMRLFSIPNGGYRSALEASIMNGEGSMPGVSDLILAVPRKDFGAMFIEVKTPTGRLSPYQVRFIKEMQNDYMCVVIKSVEEFLKEVKEYLNQKL